MKWAILLTLMVSQAANAFPYRCESEEKIGDKPAINFKVNKKVNHDGWNLYMIGVTPGEGLRQIVYGSGRADERGITMTFVKNHFVLGSVQAYPNADGKFYGEANLSGVNKNRVMDVVCFDLAEQQE